jgi:hypothetical protein
MIQPGPTTVYLLAHQGPLRSPRPVEVQHMRILITGTRYSREVDEHFAELVG